MTTKDEVKALWKLCFEDSDEFIDLYFDMRYRDGINMAVREDGKIISALQMIPYPMTFCGAVIPISYISGACTHPDYRERGAMRRLLRETHRRMYDDGVWLGSLIPAEEWLFGYYAGAGYTPGFAYAVEQFGADGLVREHSCCRTEVCDLPGAEHFRYFDTRMRMRGCCVLHSEDDFLIIMADLKLGGGYLVVAREAERIVGMAFVVRENDTLCVKELLADCPAVKNALLYEAAYRIYNVREIKCMVPSLSGTPFLGMARVIRAGEMLGLWARKHPEAELYVRLEGDDVIPENNGYYTVKGGICLRGRTAGAEYVIHTPASFTRMLLETEHPYMSLMLN